MVAKKTATGSEEPNDEKAVEVFGIEMAEILVPISGLTPIICNSWSDEAQRMMRDKQMGKAVRKRSAKDPDAEFKSSMYTLDDGRPGMPSAAFKAAIVDSYHLFDGLKKVFLKTSVFVIGYGTDLLVPISGVVTMREDFVRNATGVADIRYRAQIADWSAELQVRFNQRYVSSEQVINLINAAGNGGVGAWRPSSRQSSSGSYGMWTVKQ